MKLLNRLKHEPVAFYGGVLSALLVILALSGVGEDTLATVATVATLLGIPVTRAQVTPVARQTDEAGHSGAEGLIAVALGIALGLIIWSVLGAHTDLY